MVRRSLVFSALVLWGCDTGATVGRPPATPAEVPEDGPPRSSEGPPPPAAPPPDPAPAPPDPTPLPPPASPPATPAAYQRPDAVQDPHAVTIERAPSPPPVVWRRVDIALFSVEMPAPIHIGDTREDGGRYVSSDLGPLHFSSGETSTPLAAELSASTFLRTLLASEPGSVTKRDAVRDGQFVRTSVVVSHLDGSATRVELGHATLKGVNWLLWRKVRDATGRTDRPEVGQFFSSVKPVPRGEPKPVKAPAKR